MKLIGSVFIIFASVVSSYFYEKTLKENMKNTDELYDLINYIKINIEYFSTPINEILISYSYNSIFIQELIGKSNLKVLNFLDSNTKSNLNSFFNELGKGYKKEQIALCEYNLKILDALREKMKMEFSNKSKLFRSLSLFSGIGCVILLI